MNKSKWTSIAIIALGLDIVLGIPMLAQTRHRSAPAANSSSAKSALTQLPGGKTSAAAQSGEEFYIISSIDAQKNQLLLKLPTEVTRIMSTGPRTSYVDENGRAIKLIDLRAGDTVWILTSGGSGADQVAVRIRKGPMTPAELHKRFLPY